jgi:hypothetical protein
MDMAKIVDAVFDDLVLVASSIPNERLPKEEQIRCRIYAVIRPLFHVVCAERGYDSIDNRSRIECDLWASSPGQPPVWLEFKRCWSVSGPGWYNKPPEQLGYWKSDLDKLHRVSVESERYFLIVGFFDFDPLSEVGATHSGVVQNIRRFHTEQVVHRSSKKFVWRAGDNISWVGAWAWHWPSGVAIGVGAQPANAPDSLQPPVISALYE